jgi:hypothetical protein
MIVDEMEKRRTRCNHEAAHAVAGHLLRHRIIEIDVDNPDDGAGGWVVFDNHTTLTQVRRFLRERAVIFRVGGLYTGTDWLGSACEPDRQAVRKIAGYLGIPADAFEVRVTAEAERLVADLRFKPAHDRLAPELLQHLHEKMPGEPAHQIMEAGLHEAAIVNT